MRADGRTGCFAALAGALGAMSGFIAGVIVLVVGFFGVVLPMGLNGCRISGDLSQTLPDELGMIGQVGTPTTVRLPSCHPGTAWAVQLVDGDGAILWRAEAEAEQPVREFLVGFPPTGFVDAVPFVTPLDSEVTYQVQVLRLPNPDEAGPAPGAPELVASAIGRFAPVDLRPDQVLVDDQLVGPDVFDATACEGGGE